MAAMQFEYHVELSTDGQALAEHGSPVPRDLTWSPEHLLLESLLRCSVQSLAFHADRAGIAVSASGKASSVVQRPRAEQRMRMADVTCELDVALDPLPGPADVAQLLADAEHDCFVGASLKPATSYRWHVNGELCQPAGTPTGLREPRGPAEATTTPREMPNTAGLACDRCGRSAPAGDLAEWHAWNPADLGRDVLTDEVGAHVLICPECRVEEQSPEELGGGD